jgi:transcriptional regulator of arginine metabolism
MNRRERQSAILGLVRERALSTQAEVAAALKENGFEVVQTTVSRDIHELGLIKVRNAAGKLVYAPPGATDMDRIRELGGTLRQLMLSCEPSGNLVLVSTPSGFAGALCEAIDRSNHPMILGTVAGENTILVIAREGTTGAALADDLKAHLLEGAA